MANKVISINGKKKTKSIVPQLQIEETKLKKHKTSRWMQIHGKKILTPHEIVKLNYEGYEVYSDVRCKSVALPFDMLEAAKERNEVVILLRTTKTKDGDVWAFTQTIADLQKLRKWRIVNAKSLFEINKMMGHKTQTAVEFMESIIGAQLEASEEEIQERFLSSDLPDLIIADIKRMIHLFYEQYQNENGVSN